VSDYLSQIKEISEAIDSAVSGNHKKFDMYLNGRGDSFYKVLRKNVTSLVWHM